MKAAIILTRSCYAFIYTALHLTFLAIDCVDDTYDCTTAVGRHRFLIGIIIQAVHTVTFELGNDVVEERLEKWLQV